QGVTQPLGLGQREVQTGNVGHERAEGLLQATHGDLCSTHTDTAMLRSSLMLR
ncbi:MAG: hypothetical protein RIS59_869, partial [Pseudomonadota bacterium]